MKIFKSKTDALENLSDSENQVIRDFLEKYTSNPPLDPQQEELVDEISMINIFYFLYSSLKDSKKPEDVKSYNDGIDTFFEKINAFDDEGNLMKK